MQFLARVSGRNSTERLYRLLDFLSANSQIRIAVRAAIRMPFFKCAAFCSPISQARPSKFSDLNPSSFNSAIRTPPNKFHFLSHFVCPSRSQPQFRILPSRTFLNFFSLPTIQSAIEPKSSKALQQISHSHSVAMIILSLGSQKRFPRSYFCYVCVTAD
jgi:hypothetical protein